MMMATGGLPKKLFKGIKFLLVKENDTIKKILKEGGAQREYYVTDLLNYVIADNCDFHLYKQAVEAKVYIYRVSCSGGGGGALMRWVWGQSGVIVN